MKRQVWIDPKSKRLAPSIDSRSTWLVDVLSRAMGGVYCTLRGHVSRFQVRSQTRDWLGYTDG